MASRTLIDLWWDGNNFKGNCDLIKGHPHQLLRILTFWINQPTLYFFRLLHLSVPRLLFHRLCSHPLHSFLLSTIRPSPLVRYSGHDQSNWSPHNKDDLFCGQTINSQAPHQFKHIGHRRFLRRLPRYLTTPEMFSRPPPFPMASGRPTWCIWVDDWPTWLWLLPIINFLLSCDLSMNSVALSQPTVWAAPFHFSTEFDDNSNGPFKVRYRNDFFDQSQVNKCVSSSHVHPVLDAGGFPPHGLVDGTFSSLGEYDQCLAITIPSDLVKRDRRQHPFLVGGYCLLQLGLTPRPTWSNWTMVTRNHSDFDLSNENRISNWNTSPVNLTANGLGNTWFERVANLGLDFLPSLGGLRMGVCVPSTCSTQDVHIILNRSK